MVSQCARANGIRCVFQELSLCPNLTVAENVRIVHALAERASAGKSAAMTWPAKSLMKFSPAMASSPNDAISDLPIGKRQMAEIARAFTVTDSPLRLVILDEPTSSLDAVTARQLLSFVRKQVAKGTSVILISHLLGDILGTCDRIVVMKDGKTVAERVAKKFDRHSLVAAMGTELSQKRSTAVKSSAKAKIRSPDCHSGKAKNSAPIPANSSLTRVKSSAWPAYAGHGQTRMLLQIFFALE